MERSSAVSTRFSLAFAIVQALGVCGAVLWEVASGQAAKWLWVMEFFLLMPGNLASGSVVEATLWNSQLSLRALSVINLALAVVINGAVWYGIRSVVHRVAAGKAAP